MVTWTKVGESQIKITLQGTGSSQNSTPTQEDNDHRRLLVLLGIALAVAGVYYLSKKK